jgi:hypothetical protein
MYWNTISDSKATTFSIAYALQRRAKRRWRQVELIATLRRLTYLASLAHNDEPRLNERSRLARLVGNADDVLRRLLAESAEKKVDRG